ncbi:MAG TPA: sterol desaturase family protein [Stellaceae bacterium]|nr:sterol desaturase family protein [Stellaceae bacterium]
MAERLISWAATVAVVYAVLLATYLAACLVVERLNRRMPGAKIQPRATPAEQIGRDRRQSLVSLAGIAVLFGTGHFLYAAFGWGLRPWRGPVGITFSFVLSMVLFDTWFYWLHRLIHTRPLYRRVHRWHHLTVTPVVWSNNSDRLLDNLFLQSYWLVAHFLVPAAPAVLLAHKLYDQITGVAGHSGFEHGGVLCRPPSPLVGVTHHDQHHRYFRCNYATHFSLWDRLMGTLHPEHDAELRRNLGLAAASHRSPPPPIAG